MGLFLFALLNAEDYSLLITDNNKGAHDYMNTTCERLSGTRKDGDKMLMDVFITPKQLLYNRLPFF